MKQFTQSNLRPGNCWQTAIVCILDVEPATMPPQHELGADAVRAHMPWGSYNNILNGYLRKHHGLVYFEIQQFMFGGVRPSLEYHLMNGPTVRTSELKDSDNYHINHCVVGRNGEPVWDVHPSRAGLTAVHTWGVLGELQKTDEAEQRRERKLLEDENYRLIFSCVCPACGLDELRRVVASRKENP